MEPGTAGLQALEVLRRHLPFSRMGATALELLARNLGETFHPAGEVILEIGRRAPTHLLIVKQGRVRGGPQPAGDGTAHDRWDLTEGDIFPVRSLLEGRAPRNTYRAAEDTFCYLVPEAVFHQLLQSSPEFLEFCSRRLEALTRAAADASQAATARNVMEMVPLTAALGSLLRRAPIVCSPDTPLLEAFRIMARERVGSIVAVDGNGRPQGILTLRDVLPRVVLPHLPLETPLARVMSSPARALEPGAPSWRAALEMARWGMGHLCVVADGRLVGVVSERDLFPMQRARLVPITRAIVEAPDLQALQAAVRGVDPLVNHMLAQGLSSVPLIEIVTTLNDHTARRAIELCTQDFVAERGALPCAFTWLSFGSEGRQEQTLKTDQDNGMLLQLGHGQSAEDARQALLPLARQINAALEACGFPRCPGNIMAENPACCLSLEEWRDRFARWVDQGAPEHLLDASIFFDLRALHGDERPVLALREWLRGHVPANERFLHQMAENALRQRPPLTWLDNIAVTRGGEHPNTIDLKRQCSTPFVDGARIYALATGGEETNTVRRLRAAAAAGHLPQEEVEGWVASWTYLQSLRMQLHQRQTERSEPLSNHIDPDELNALEQRLLKEVLRQVRQLQTRLALDYGT